MTHPDQLAQTLSRHTALSLDIAQQWVDLGRELGWTDQQINEVAVSLGAAYGVLPSALRTAIDWDKVLR